MLCFAKTGISHGEDQISATREDRHGMIDAKKFENNFLAHHKQKLDEYNLGIVRLYAERVTDRYRAIEISTKPLDEDKVPLGYLRTHEIAEKFKAFGISLMVQNSGRGEGEIDMTRSFCLRLDEYNEGDDSRILKALDKLKAAETEFYAH